MFDCLWGVEGTVGLSAECSSVGFSRGKSMEGLWEGHFGRFYSIIAVR